MFGLDGLMDLLRQDQIGQASGKGPILRFNPFRLQGRIGLWMAKAEAQASAAWILGSDFSGSNFTIDLDQIY